MVRCKSDLTLKFTTPGLHPAFAFERPLMPYTPSEIEAKWQAAWDKAETFKAVKDTSKPKYYVLEMFPYPSGRIHIGHVRNYTMGDVIARYKLATGHAVLHPMGFDAFGMPAENAAMASGGHPKDWTYQNIDDMVEQMKPLGLGIDWSRMFATCDPEYYGQQQALFIDMLDAGLIDRKNATVNWDPVDMTVLANEQVIDGKGWRSGAEVERKDLTPTRWPKNSKRTMPKSRPSMRNAARAAQRLKLWKRRRNSVLIRVLRCVTHSIHHGSCRSTSRTSS